ncbi:hypothetical protein SAMN04488000_12689 [Lentzea albida]|uniref:Methyltransferase domain-containing protein n=1 Tax=Lentzea albida TaxID=65499 RepID=A0A1H9X1F8_9PSEU|nr:hypothetical protein SAMN04488000_12689 [Lentzea albida]
MTRLGDSHNTEGSARRPGARPPRSARADANRRPYPTAPNVSRVSPARPAKPSPSRTTSSTPATVWSCGSTPIALDETWPTQLVVKVVSAFSRTRDRVVVLPWPTNPSSTSDAVDAANNLGRRASCGSEVDWNASGFADLVVTSASPNQTTAELADEAVLTAARLLRLGGIFVALTHNYTTTGELTDHTGQLVTRAQFADLLYLQHVVALHAPIRDGRFQVELNDREAEELGRAQHRAAVRGLPSPHLRIHSDVLVFAQPHDHLARPLTPARAAAETGVIR